jgi:pimeloyl-ACP methyl ester carboxylesterase
MPDAHFDVTFVPGAAGLGAFWDPLVEKLPSTWTTRTFNLPGLGPVPPQKDVQSYSDLVDHVARAIPGPTVLVGQSMGGYVSLELALRYPERVSHLVLMVAAGGVDMSAHGALDWRVQEREENPARRQRQPWALAPTPDLTAQLTHIKVPVLLLWATRDPLSPLSVAEHLAAHLPRARLVTFETDDHWVARRFAGEAARALHDWLLEANAPSPTQRP